MKNLYIILLLTFGFSQDYSLSFDGVDDYVGIENQPLSQIENFTVSAWISPENFDKGGAFVCVGRDAVSGSRSGFAFGIGGTQYNNNDGHNFLASVANQAWINTGYTFPDENEWYYVSMVRGNSTFIFYVNGIPTQNSYSSSASPIFPSEVFIGASDGDENYANFDGYIKSVEIWNNSLSQAEIQNNMQDGPDYNNENLVSYWSFNTGSDNILYDHSGNGNHGTINGATWAGCTNPLADNYLPNAEVDDGSCCIELWGECYNIEETTELTYYNNGITGSIPSGIGNLVNLTRLDLSGNNLTGNIPSEIGNLTNLTFLDLGQNELTGEIPLSIENLINLNFLELGVNALSGNIPENIGNLTNLTYLELYRNQLTGEIPSSISNLSNLDFLFLSDNQLSGQISESICNLSIDWSGVTEWGEEYLQISNNQLCPPYPSCLTDEDIGTQDTSECEEPSLCNEGYVWIENIPLDFEDIPISNANCFYQSDLDFLQILINNSSETINMDMDDNVNGQIEPLELGWDQEWVDGRLIDLDLESIGLSGEIPTEIGGLIQLIKLDMSENYLTGEIPSEIGNLINLSDQFRFNDNELTGQIPVEICSLTQLTEIEISGNELTGEIPECIGELILLDEIEFQDNQLTGSLPEGIGNLENIEFIWLGDNQLTGEIPSSIGNLSNLELLDLRNNQLSGEIPSEIGDLENLQGLWLIGNNIIGDIPSEIGDLVNLWWLWLSNNQITSIPESISNLSNLEIFWIDNNDLTELPNSICDLNVNVLYGLNDNMSGDSTYNFISGNNYICENIPECIGDIEGFNYSSYYVVDDEEEEHLILQYEPQNCEEPSLCDEEIEVELWDECYNIEETTELDLSMSGLAGEIPPEIGMLTNLVYLNLSHNELIGSIPQEIGNLVNLEQLNLESPWEGGGGNFLSGEIPSEIGNLINLTHLRLTGSHTDDGNNISGAIPPEIGNLVNLTHLGLSGNPISGEIPAAIWELTNLTVLGISSGSITGIIPSEIGSLTNLVWLGLAGNQLSGNIPPEIGNLVNLQSLYLHSNQLTGEIPPQIFSLSNLEILTLGWNNLSGVISDDICNLNLLDWGGDCNGYVCFNIEDNQFCPEYPDCIADLMGYQDTESCYGCTDSYAENYDETANVDDGSCTYPDNGDYSLSFDGENDYVEGGQNPSLDNLNQLTVMAYCKFDEDGGFDGIIEKATSTWGNQFPSATGWYLRKLGYNPDDSFYNNKLNFNLITTGGKQVYLSSVEVPIGEYVHVAATYDGNEGKIFINGIEGTEIWEVIGGGGDITNNDRSVAFGISRWGQTNDEGIHYSELLDGNVGDIRVFNEALSQNDIQYYIENPPLEDEEGLLGYWKFNAGTGDTLYDHSGNGNHGTINGAMWVENIYGCTDSYADNYNPEANWNDSSCAYIPNNENDVCFDGSQFIEVSSITEDIIFNNDFTLGIRVLFNNSGGQNDGLFSKAYNNENNHGFSLRRSAESGAEDVIGFVSRDTGYNVFHFYGTSVVETNDWTEITLVKSGNNFYRYINGILDGVHSESTNSFSGLISMNNEPLLIGGHGDVANLRGCISNAFLIDRALEQSEVENIFSDNLLGIDDLVANWNHQYLQGNYLIDISGNENHGEINTNLGCTDSYAENYNPYASTNDGSCTYPDNGDYSLSFDGVDDYVNINQPISLEAGNSASFVFWFHTSVVGEEGIFLSNDTQASNPDFKIQMEFDGNISVKGKYNDNNETRVTTSEPLNDGLFHQVVGISTGTSCVKLYIDGENIGEDCHGGANYESGDDYYIGRERLSGEYQRGYNGFINQFSIYNRILSENEILDIYNANILPEAGIIASYNFNADTGDTLYDHSGNGNHGTIHGANWIENIYGCTHPNATNYDETANVDDGSCEYETVAIGHQVWMTENLKATHYRNGDKIPTGLSGSEWASTNDGAYGIYDDDPANADVYGNLYNWYAVDDDRGICPVGFYVPSDPIFLELEMFLGMSQEVAELMNTSRGDNEGSELAADASKWNDGLLESNEAFGSSGFMALPGGYKEQNQGDYIKIGESGSFWTTDLHPNDNPIYRNIYYNESKIGRTDTFPIIGFSIRCLSDETLNTTILVPENFATIQEAIDYSIDGDTILVSAGTYYENINFNGKNIAIIGEDRETTIIDGGQNGSVVVIENIEINTAILSKFTITNGFSSEGGGVSILNSSAHLEDLVIKNNNSSDYAGGLSVRNTNLTYSNCKINSNSAAHAGGGLLIANSTTVGSNSIIANNDASTLGNAIYSHNSNDSIINCNIIGNYGSNTAAIALRENENTFIVNVIIKNNAGSSISYLEQDWANDALVNYSNIQGGYEGEGNIDVDPLFTNPDNGDFTLQPSSPCIDAGDPDSELDPDGTIADMGAYPTYQGCTDPYACNYNPLATTDDDSCAELDPCGVCDGQAECLVLDSDLFGTWQYETTLYYSNNDCSGEGEVMDASEELNPPDQAVLNADGTAIIIELSEEFLCSEYNCADIYEYGSCYQDEYCASIVYQQWGVVEGTNEIWLISGSNYFSPGNYSFDTNGNLSVNSNDFDCIDDVADCCLEIIFNPIIDYTDYTLDLHAGANLISFYALPENNSVSNVLSSLGENATGVITEGGASIQTESGTWVGSLTEIFCEKGYWIIVDNSDTLNIYDASNCDNEYDLHSGANLISFPSSGSADISDAIPDDIELAIFGIITEGGAAIQISPYNWIGSLTSFNGGKGYWVISSMAISFSFDLSTLSRTNIAYKEEKLDGYEYVQSTKQAFYFIESIEGINDGDYILSFNGDNLIGSRQWQGSIIDVPAMGSDGNSYSSAYMKTGDTPTFKLLSGGKLTTLEGEVPTWSDNGLFMVSSLSQVVIPEAYSLSQAYPNPFNPTTTLSFAIPIDSEVSLSVYNLQGREVSSLIDGYMDAGYHSIVWDANSYASGVYFVKMVAGEFVNTQKLMLIK